MGTQNWRRKPSYSVQSQSTSGINNGRPAKELRPARLLSFVLIVAVAICPTLTYSSAIGKNWREVSVGIEDGGGSRGPNQMVDSLDGTLENQDMVITDTDGEVRLFLRSADGDDDDSEESMSADDDDDDSEESMDFDESMDESSFDSAGQTGDDGHRPNTRQPVSTSAQRPPDLTSQPSPVTVPPTTEPLTSTVPTEDTTPGTCIVCENILLISENALREYMELFNVFETTSEIQQGVVTMQLNSQQRPCGPITATDGNTARIRFRVSVLNVTLNDTFSPVGILQSSHDGPFVEGVGSLRTIIDQVTGAESRQIQREPGGPFQDFPPTQEVCRTSQNCDPSATRPPSSTMPMATAVPPSQIWPDPGQMQFHLSGNITLCESLQCLATVPGSPQITDFCRNLLNRIPV